MRSKTSNFLFYVLLAIVFLLPIPLGANRPWAWSFFQILIFALSMGCAVHFRGDSHLGLGKHLKIVCVWGAFIILAGLQIIPMPEFLVALISPKAHEMQAVAHVSTFYFSLDPGQTGISFLKLLAYFCLFICTLLLVDSEKRIKLLLTTMVAAGTIQAIYGALEILLSAPQSLVFGLDVNESATGSFVYKNHYANFLMMCLAAGIGLMVASLQKDQMNSPKDWMRSIATAMLSSKALIRISLVIMVIALVMSRSRMGNTAFFVAMTIVGLMTLFLVRQRSKGLTILIMSMFVIDLLIVSTWFGLEKVQQRLAETSLQQESRDEVIRDALPMVLDFPITGTGAGSFYSTFPAYKTTDVDAFYDQAHNDFLQMTIEYGVPSISILAFLVSFAFYKSARAMRHRRSSIFKGTSFACCMVIIGMLLHMTVDFPLQAFANASYFVIFISLSVIISSLQLQRPRRVRSSR
ncbi:O-antigen ligase family protein [Brumicola pallidula]|uniref:O-antigen polymerase n=1 Tax=Brumicola pallidula DSM 14239 = ACAM 615 TaxID=1121922 RepID=K6YYZ7_9ALTE|nr:O-antigen ligase family protein [Glaciecola pallidula]GAC29196.1 O-antigen polymerase [Glaciecola pallidula DSM 14239 = ACAM 615]